MALYVGHFMQRCISLFLLTLTSLMLVGCASPTVLSQTDDSITFAFPNGRYGADDVKEDAQAYCKKKGLDAELRGTKFCTAPCLTCALQCRATFICR